MRALGNLLGIFQVTHRELGRKLCDGPPGRVLRPDVVDHPQVLPGPDHLRTSVLCHSRKDLSSLSVLRKSLHLAVPESEILAMVS